MSVLWKVQYCIDFRNCSHNYIFKTRVRTTLSPDVVDRKMSPQSLISSLESGCPSFAFSYVFDPECGERDQV